MKLAFSIFVFLGLMSLASVQPVQACSTCMCGDPTLTSMGLEKPYEGRFRLSAQNSFRTETTGSRTQNQLKAREDRLSLAGSYAIDARTTLAAYLPVVWKDGTSTNQAHQEVFGLGDIHLQARILWIDPQHGHGSNLFGIIAGTMLPTGATHRGSNNDPLDVQTGTGSWLAEGGLWYAHFAFPWSLYASATTQVTILHRDWLKPGTAVLSNFGSQYQITSAWAVQGALESRWADQNKEFGVMDENSGGFVTFVSPRVLYSPKQDVLLQIGAQVPILEKKNGFHEEGVTLQGGVIYDF